LIGNEIPLYHKRIDPKTVQQMLRHAKVQTPLDLYAQGDNDNKISAQDRFCGLIVDQPASAVNAQTIQKNWRGRRDSNPRPLP